MSSNRGEAIVSIDNLFIQTYKIYEEENDHIKKKNTKLAKSKNEKFIF